MLNINVKMIFPQWKNGIVKSKSWSWLVVVAVVSLLVIRKVLHFHYEQSAMTLKKNSALIKSGVAKQANIKNTFQLLKRPCKKDN